MFSSPVATAEFSKFPGMLSAYIKCNGQNYKIPRGTNPASLDAESAKAIVDSGGATSHSKRAAGRRKTR